VVQLHVVISIIWHYITNGIQCLCTWIKNFGTWCTSDTGFCKLFLMYDLGNSVFNAHQVPKVIHVNQHQIPQVHARHCQLYMTSYYNIVKFTTSYIEIVFWPLYTAIKFRVFVVSSGLGFRIISWRQLLIYLIPSVTSTTTLKLVKSACWYIS
jgi:hypothetical protein